MKVFEVGKSGTGFRLSQIPRSSVTKHKFKKLISDFDVIVTSRTPYDTYLKKMINCAKFDVCKPNSFGRAKTDRQTSKHNCALCIRLAGFGGVARQGLSISNVGV